MGKPTGFKEFEREVRPYRNASIRLLDFKELYTIYFYIFDKAGSIIYFYNQKKLVLNILFFQLNKNLSIL